MDEKVKEQILAIRDTGLTKEQLEALRSRYPAGTRVELLHMFDVNMVQRLAYDRGYYELALYLEDHRKEYAHFILTGEAE